MAKEQVIALRTQHPTEAFKLTKLRLGFMRGLYLLNFISLAFDNLTAIFFPSQQRPHLSCGMMTPDQVHRTNLKPEQLWKNCWKSTTVNQQQDYHNTVNLCQD